MFITFLLVMLAAALIFLFLSIRAIEQLEYNHYEQRADLYRYTRIKKGDIVFVGDSITDGGNWEELFPGMPVKNRGINADDTHGVLARIDDILCCSPAAIFLLIGTNDLIWWLYRHDDDILKTYEHILEHIKQAAPQTQVFIQSILPRKKHYCKRIKSINSELKKFAKKFKYTYIDLFPHFADATGALKAKFNNDHLHLLAPGYETWVKLLTPYIDNFRKK